MMRSPVCGWVSCKVASFVAHGPMNEAPVMRFCCHSLLAWIAGPHNNNLHHNPHSECVFWVDWILSNLDEPCECEAGRGGVQASQCTRSVTRRGLQVDNVVQRGRDWSRVGVKEDLGGLERRGEARCRWAWGWASAWESHRGALWRGTTPDSSSALASLPTPAVSPPLFLLFSHEIHQFWAYSPILQTSQVGFARCIGMKDFRTHKHQHGQFGDAQLSVMGIGTQCLKIRGLVPFFTSKIGSLFMEWPHNSCFWKRIFLGMKWRISHKETTNMDSLVMLSLLWWELALSAWRLGV